jgi:hypothetical protein
MGRCVIFSGAHRRPACLILMDRANRSHKDIFISASAQGAGSLKMQRKEPQQSSKCVQSANLWLPLTSAKPD